MANRPKASTLRRPRDLSGALLRQGQAPRGPDGHYISWASFRPVDKAGRPIALSKLPTWVREKIASAKAAESAARKRSTERPRAPQSKKAAKPRAPVTPSKKTAAPAAERARERQRLAEQEEARRAKKAKEDKQRRELRKPRDPSGALLEQGRTPRGRDGSTLAWDGFLPVDGHGEPIAIGKLPSWVQAERRRAQSDRRRAAAEEAERRRQEKLQTAREARREAERAREIERAFQAMLAEQRRQERAEQRELRKAAADAKKRAEAELAERLRQQTEEAKRQPQTTPPRPPAPPTPPVSAPPGPPGQQAVEVITASEVLDAILLDTRAKADGMGKLDRIESDRTLVRNPTTGSVGMKIKVESLLDRDVIADLKKTVQETALDIQGVMRSERTKVFVSIFLTEFGRNLIGSPTSVIMETNEGALTQGWQGVKGKSAPRVGKAFERLLERLLAQQPRNSAMVEGLIIRGYVPKATKGPTTR